MVLDQVCAFLQCFASKFLAKNDNLQFELFLELYSSLFRSLPSHRNLFHLDQDKGLSEEIGRKVIIKCISGKASCIFCIIDGVDIHVILFISSWFEQNVIGMSCDFKKCQIIIMITIINSSNGNNISEILWTFTVIGALYLMALQSRVFFCK